jgi:ribose transport system substrate-binding protein
MKRSLCLALISLVALACGAESSSSGTQGSSSAQLNHAKQLLQQYEAVPPFVSPGDPFDAKKVAGGKTVFSLPSNLSIPFIQATSEAYHQLAAQVGVKVINWPNQGQTSQWVQGMDTAIARKVDLIDLLDGTDPRLIMPQVEKAKAAGIPVVDTHDLDVGQEHPPNVAAFVDGHFVTAGELMAAWALTQTNGKANALVITSNNYQNSFPVTDGMRKEFKADCPTCKVQYVNVNGPDWASKIQPAVQTAITNDPQLNFVLPTFDSMLVYVVAGVLAAAAKGRVHAASYNGTPATLDLIRTSGVVTFDVGENPADIAAAGLDQDMRVMAGLPPSKDEHLVLRAFTPKNVDEAGNPAALGQGYGDAWRTGYAKTWQLPSL